MSYGGESPEAAPETDFERIMWIIGISLFVAIAGFGMWRLFSMFA